MRNNRKETIAYIGLTLMATIIGFSFIFVKFALRSAPPVDLLAHRFSVAAVALILYYAIVKKEMPKFEKQNILRLLLLSLFYPILLFSMQTIGLQFTTASEAGILSATAPIITVIFASVFLKEKNTLWQNLSVLLSVGGVIYIMYKNGLGQVSAETLKGDFFIMLSVVAMAFYFVLGRKMSQKMNPMDITFFMTLTACVVFNVISVSNHISQGNLPDYFSAFTSSEFLWSILYLGVLSSFLTSFLTNNALTVIPAAQVSIFNNFSPIIAVLGGVIFLSETLHLYHIIGGVMVMLGIVGVNVLRENDR